MADALPSEEYIPLKQKQNELFGLIRSTGSPEAVGKFLEIEDTLEKSRIHFYTLPEFKFALERCGQSSESIASTIVFQNAHANVADSLWESRVVYLLELSKAHPGANWPCIGHSSVRVFHPSDWTCEEVQQAESQIHLATKTYGCEYSESNKEALRLSYPLSFSF